MLCGDCLADPGFLIVARSDDTVEIRSAQPGKQFAKAGTRSQSERFEELSVNCKPDAAQMVDVALDGRCSGVWFRDLRCPECGSANAMQCLINRAIGDPLLRVFRFSEQGFQAFANQGDVCQQARFACWQTIRCGKRRAFVAGQRLEQERQIQVRQRRVG